MWKKTCSTGERSKLEHLNEVTAWWLKEVADVRLHRETKQRPIDRFQDEAACLTPLRAQPYDTAEFVYRCVSTEGWVAYAQNRYSVPWRYIGLTVPVRITETEVIIYGPHIEEIARHPLFPRQEAGRISRLKEHEPRDDSEKKYEILKQRFDELGEAEQGGWSHLQLLERLFAEPAANKRERSVARRIREAHFPGNNTLESFDWEFNAPAIDRVQIEELATGDFIRRADNLLMVGQSGIGKTHLLEGIGRRACSPGYRGCEFEGPSGHEDFDLFFPDYESLLDYCRKKFKNWDGRLQTKNAARKKK